MRHDLPTLFATTKATLEETGKFDQANKNRNSMKRVVRVWKSAQGCIGCRLVRRNLKSMPLHFSSELLRSPMYPSGWLLANSAGQLSSPGISFVTNSSATNSGRYGRYGHDLMIEQCSTFPVWYVCFKMPHTEIPHSGSQSVSAVHLICMLHVACVGPPPWRVNGSLHFLCTPRRWLEEMTLRSGTGRWQLEGRIL